MTKRFQDEFDVQVIHAWGMTEMSPLGTLGTMKPETGVLRAMTGSTSRTSRAFRRSAWK